MKTTPNELFAKIVSNVKSFLEWEPYNFEEKPYLWVYERDDEFEAETCEEGDEPAEDMFEYADLWYEDEETGKVCMNKEKIWKIVDIFFPKKRKEIFTYEFPRVFDDPNIQEICSVFRDAIAAGDMRGAPEINIRYSTDDNVFCVAPLGDYFFYEGRLYVFDKLPAYEKFHDENAVVGFFGHSCPNRGYAHCVAYCGFQTPYKDNLGDYIFTGDVCYVRDLPRNNGNKWSEGSYHVMTSMECEGYGFVGDNCMFLVEHCKRAIQRVGTIFYFLSFDTIKNTWVGEISTMYGPSHYQKAYLTMSKLTPCFSKDYEDYFIMSVINGKNWESDWRYIHSRDRFYPLQASRKKSKRLGLTIDDLNEGAIEKPEPLVAPDVIKELKEDEIFVFGSNIRGEHRGGAARFAYENFGAEYGIGEGLRKQTYALPTMEGESSFEAAVGRFLAFAKRNPKLKFLVTPVGCGIAGYKPEQVAPWFRPALNIYNVYLPKCFLKVLTK